MRNRAVKSRCHTSAKKFLAALQQKDQNLAQEAFRALQSELDNAKRKGVIKHVLARRAAWQFFLTRHLLQKL